jgi:hypothetical protein
MKEQRQWNRERHDHRGAEAHQKENQHDQHQDHSAQKVRFHRIRSQFHQIAAVVVRHHFDVGRQDVIVKFFCFLLHAFEHVLRLIAAQHQDDAFDGVIRLVEPEFPKPRSAADGDFADVFHPHRHAVLRSDDDVSDVRLVPNQAEPADVIELSTLRIKSPAGVGVVHGELVDHLRHRDVIAVELGGVEQNLILHHGSAEA